MNVVPFEVIAPTDATSSYFALSYSPLLNPTVLFVVSFITFPFSEISATASSPLILPPIFSIFPTEFMNVLSPEISESKFVVVSFLTVFAST